MTRRALALAAALTALASCKTPQPCPTPLVECNGQCVDVQSNQRHCGSCGNACAGGRSCIGGSCTPQTRAACPDRTAGAFVTVERCGEAVKVWVQDPTFVDSAASYVLSTAPPLVPVLTVVPGTDCDAQWSWSAGASSAAFAAPGTIPGCDVCPSVVQADVPSFVAAPGKWCARMVLAVDPRP